MLLFGAKADESSWQIIHAGCSACEVPLLFLVVRRVLVTIANGVSFRIRRYERNTTASGWHCFGKSANLGAASPEPGKLETVIVADVNVE
jgi:hypothetical protein